GMTTRGGAGCAAAGRGCAGALLGRQAAMAAQARKSAAGLQPAGAAPSSKDLPDPLLPAPDLLDPQWLRWTDREIRRWLKRILALGAPSSPPLAARAELSLSLMETTLAPAGGRRLHQRGTLADLKLRFPTAFGLSRLRLAARRLEDLDERFIQEQMSSFPPPGKPPQRVLLTPGGDHLLVVSPQVTAWLLERFARQAVARGPVVWKCPAVLKDDPARPWGPGSFLFDGQGRPCAPALLAGPQQALGEGGRPSFPQVRISYRQPPQPVPTNLILSHLPEAAVPGTDYVHLLEPVVRSAEGCLVRGVRQTGAGSCRPILARLAAGLEDLLDEDSRAAPGKAYVPGTGFVAAATLLASPVSVTDWGG
ncbi:MAG: hypothetical protein ACE5ID_10390, partial [Acidobacteriota bacterium]